MSRKFAFICTGPGVEQDDEKDIKFAARSHTAKVNRKKRAMSRRLSGVPRLGIQPAQSAALLTSTGLGSGALPDLSSPEVAETIDFLFRSVLVQAFTASEISHWFQGFCETPLLYYTFTHHGRFVRNRMQAVLPGDEWRCMLSTRTSAHRLIQQFLADPSSDQRETERVLLAMALTSQHERNPSDVDDLALCRPHMLYAEGFDVSRVRQLKGFLPAAASLINRLPDGLSSLVDTGLFRILCMVDLISAASEFKRPFFPCGWKHPFEIDLTKNGDENKPGHGFSRLRLGRLPRSATFVKICHLDRFMAQYNRLHLSSADFQDLLAWRNAAVHELLCLPLWEHLSNEERQTSSPDFYNCCRLAATVYSNAVICATPASCMGIAEPLRQLTMCDFKHWEYDRSMVAIWSLFAGGIAAYGTVYWGSVVQTLRDLTRTHRITALEEVQPILRRFLWSDSACDVGAKALWGAVIGEDSRRIEQRIDI